MFIDDLINGGGTTTLERMLRFTEARQNLLTEDVANVSTPNYKQRDLSVAAFQHMLQQRLDAGTETAGSGDGGDPVADALSAPTGGLLSHDGNNRSMERLMSEGAKNALMHNTVVELLRSQYQTLDMALKERVG